MKSWQVALFLVFFWNFVAGKDYTGHNVVRIVPKTPEDVDKVQEMEFDGQIKLLRNGFGTFGLLPPGPEREILLGKLDKLNLHHEIDARDVGWLIEQERERIGARRDDWEILKQVDERPVPFDVLNFHSHGEINGYLNDLADYYDFVSVLAIGATYEGREQLAVQICTGTCGAKPALWVDAGIHSSEWLSPAAAVYLIDRLVQTLPDEDQDLIEDVDWIILPVLNADGYEFTREVDRYWRKTRSLNAGTLCVGVDANRNFDYEWGHVSGGDADPCSDMYFGPFAFSEVEIANVRDFLTLTNEGNAVRFYHNQHTPAQMILYPWGFLDEESGECTVEGNVDVEDQDALAQLGRDAIFAVNGTSYLVGPTCSTIYPASGIALDWAYGSAGIKYSYTVELTPGGEVAVVAPDDIALTGEEMVAFHAVAARQIAMEFAGEFPAN